MIKETEAYRRTVAFFEQFTDLVMYDEELTCEDDCIQKAVDGVWKDMPDEYRANLYCVIHEAYHRVGIRMRFVTIEQAVEKFNG